MRIKAVLSLSSKISILIVLIIVIATVALNIEIHKETDHLAMARQIRSAIFQRSILSMEYYNRGEDRPMIQARVKTEQLQSKLEQALVTFKEAEHSRMLAEVVSANNNFIRLFEQYVSSIQARVATGAKIAPHTDYEKIIYDQVQLKSYILQAEVEHLEAWHITRVDSLNTRIKLQLSSSIIILIILVLANSFWISRKLSKGIKQLEQGTALLGGGDLEHRLSVFPDDEIADVAREINKMAKSLAASFTSIHNLKNEVKQREHAEEEVRTINAELEKRISLRTAQLETVNKELEAFAYSVAHDLRAPLRSIDGFTKILLEEYGPSFDAEAHRLFGVIRDSNIKMDNMIRNLLELTKAGKSEISVSVLNMQTIAMDSFRTCADPSVLANFELDMGDLPETIADHSMIERVWQNLFSNAVKYSMHSPIHRVEVRGVIKDGQNIYSVRDHGAGFEQRYVDKLFGMFQRLHGDSEFAGSGIGLSIVKKIIERHGGSVFAEGRVGEGATFTFSLPRRT